MKRPSAWKTRAGAGLMALLAIVVVWQRPWDPRMDSLSAARALRAKLAASRRSRCTAARAGLSKPSRLVARRCAAEDSVSYRCKREENDGTIVGMKDVDYLCEPLGNPELESYWIGTNRHSITDLQPTG